MIKLILIIKKILGLSRELTLSYPGFSALKCNLYTIISLRININSPSSAADSPDHNQFHNKYCFDMIELKAITPENNNYLWQLRHNKQLYGASPGTDL